jgi:hypothetical protein
VQNVAVLSIGAPFIQFFCCAPVVAHWQNTGSTIKGSNPTTGTGVLVHMYSENSGGFGCVKNEFRGFVQIDGQLSCKCK